ncbi:glycoside hydrolase family 9 protein [Flavobacterium nackdongense]|uniref:Endoglucanase n=1 Tax=Flavobacterium nackdongense TaxID=2547394 RepID=A0A4P6YF81_9FLAO|nr:glycoside hydrolase family 9 protein [Flavobacterium nackdongense]QBN19150.1 T9SS type A sorting domain-containing protein [Flavobacterium nackdongense]
MKKILVLLLFSQINFVASQIVYSDNFNQGINNTAYPSAAYSTSLVSENLRIVGNGTAGAYAAISYGIHDNGALKDINISGNNKLYIKVKGTGGASLRIDLQDRAGFVTNRNASSISLTTTYQIFEILYTGKFQDGGYGGSPCTSAAAPCTVNNTTIKNIIFFVNDATGKYNGTIDIDWISFGQPLEVIAPPIFIRANQVGYFKNRDKAVNLLSTTAFGPQNYKVFNSSNVVILSGVSPSSSYWSDADLNGAKIDLSSIGTNGTYTVKTDQSEMTITIADNPLEELSNASIRYFYYNRASSEITPTNGGAWARSSGTPDDLVKVHSSAATPNRPTNTTIASPKGWYDAGDLNKYIVNSGISTYTLLAAFENYKSHFITKNLNIPESTNNLPDILDEAIWNLDWMLTMQNRVSDGGDGSVYHKLSGLGFEGVIMPANYNLQRYVIGRSTSAALNFAAVMAIASRIFSDYNTQKPGYSATLLAAAKEAYTWAKNNPSMYFTANPSGVSTGAYEDNNVNDEFQWAAVELFISTGEAQYNNDVNYFYLTNQGVPSWQSTSTLGILSIANNLTNPNVVQLNTTQVLNKLTAIANTLKNNVANNVVETTMDNYDYNWGSNGMAANQIVVLLSAYKATNDSSYLNAAYKAMDYLLGRNAVGISFVTGFGESSPLKPHHRISEADGIALPVPGMLVGGPQNSNNADGCAYASTTKAGKYSDTWCSYSTNEVTINWNAPLAYATNALQYYQNQSLAINENKSTPLNNLIIYPNPTKGDLHIGRNNNFNDVLTIDGFDVNGKTVFKKVLSKDESVINIHSLTKGVYFLKVSDKEKVNTIKILKE